jgi:hypothetical protein
MIGGLPASGAVMELICMCQIDDTTPGAFEGPTTQDIDATPPQDTGESLAAPSAALVAETSTPAQARGASSLQSAPSLGVPVAGTGTQVDDHPVAFSTADFAPVGFQCGSSGEDGSALHNVPFDYSDSVHTRSEDAGVQKFSGPWLLRRIPSTSPGNL